MAGPPLDHAIRVGSVLGVSMPMFWLALILQLVFAQRLHVLPVAGEYDPNLLFTHPLADRTRLPVLDALISGNWAMLGSTLTHLILPAAGGGGLPGRADRPHGPRAAARHPRRDARADGPRARLPRADVFGRFAMKLAWNPVARCSPWSSATRW